MVLLRVLLANLHAITLDFVLVHLNKHIATHSTFKDIFLF